MQAAALACQELALQLQRTLEHARKDKIPDEVDVGMCRACIKVVQAALPKALRELETDQIWLDGASSSVDMHMRRQAHSPNAFVAAQISLHC